MPSVCWTEVEGAALHQGDYLPGIQVPFFSPAAPEGEIAVGTEAEGRAEVQIKDVIVISQTCDLLLGKLRLVALCPVQTIDEFENDQPSMRRKWKDVQKGRHEGLHLLGSCDNTTNYRSALIADFREIISLPQGYVEQHADRCGRRKRLQSPFLEHFAQAFAKFYMRIALPNNFIDVP